MIATFAALLLTSTAPLPVQPRCSSFATLPKADQKRYESRYRRRVRDKGQAVADAWIRASACPEARAAIRKRKAAPLIGKDGRPCTRTRMEMRPVSSGGSMTMVPKRVCIR